MSCATCQVGYASEVAAPQYNQGTLREDARGSLLQCLRHESRPGVAVIQDFVGLPPQVGHQVVHSDEARVLFAGGPHGACHRSKMLGEPNMAQLRNTP